MSEATAAAQQVAKTHPAAVETPPAIDPNALEFTPEIDQPFANILLYGPPKTGKTAGAATAPGKGLYLSADMPNRTRFARQRDTEKRWQWPKFKGKATLRQIMKLAWDPEGPDVVVVDPLGELYGKLLKEESNNSVHPSFDHRNAATFTMETFLRFMCEAPVNFVVVCHQLISDASEELMVVPFTGSKTGAMSGIGPKLQGMVDVIGYTAVIEQEGGGKEYVAQLVPARGRIAGDGFAVDGVSVLADPQTGIRKIDLKEWFEIAGIHQGKQSTAN